MNPQRLKQIRLARGFSLDMLAEQMDGIITKQALSKYERGVMEPGIVMLTHIARALKVTTLELTNQPEYNIAFFGFRKTARLSATEKDRVQAIVTLQLEKMIKVADIIGHKPSRKIPLRAYDSNSHDAIENAANELRDLWELGSGPISNLIDSLEDAGIYAIEIDADKHFDGISAAAISSHGDPVAAAVISRNQISGDRQRLNLAHELGHLVLNVSKGNEEGEQQKKEEESAFRFAGAFLAPAPIFINEVGKRRTYITLPELLLLKRKFKISIQTIIRRMYDLKIINQSYYTGWCIQINHLGYKRDEPEPLELEHPLWMQKTVRRAYSEKLISLEQAELFLGEKIIGQIQSNIERRAFMKLPIEDRRLILAEQARNFAAYFQTNPEWDNFDDGVDYE